MGPNSIHLHTAVLRDVGPSLHTITPAMEPNSFSVNMFSSPEETQQSLDVRYG